MLIDTKDGAAAAADLCADTVIVGAGTVGIFLGISLAKAGKRCILIESGSHIADLSRNATTVNSIGKPHKADSTGRASGLGGTSVLWGGQVAEFEEADLTRRGYEWPITYAELRRWYCEVYEVLGITNRLATEDCARLTGGETEQDARVERFFTAWLPRPNFAALFSRELASNSLIRVLLNCTVNGFHFAGPCAKAILAVDNNDRRYRISGNSFVLAGGTIANARLLLSTQRLAPVPWKHNRNIGICFQDHLGGKIASLILTNEVRFRSLFENAFISNIKYQPKLRFTASARDTQPCGASGMFVFRSSIEEHLDNVKRLARAIRSGVHYSGWRRLPYDLVVLNRALFPLVIRYVREKRMTAFFDRDIEFHVQAEQLPNQNSRIVIADDKPGPDGLYRVALDWRIDGREAAVIRGFLADVDSYLQKLGIGRLQIDKRVAESDTRLIDELSDTSHHCGGLRMSSEKYEGVTDVHCRIWDTQNVYVAGAAVFPTSSHANCTLTALALTARLASVLRS